MSAAAVRERAAEMLAAGLAGALPHFVIDLDRLMPIAEFVADVIGANYPSLRVPLHARWRHFVLGGRDLWRELAASARWRDRSSRARAEFDLAVISVLLDAGAGAAWRFHDEASGLTVSRSEGLALASLRMFAAGLFSNDPDDPLRADASRLAALTGTDLAHGFGAGSANPLEGLEGRAAVLARLGRAMLAAPSVFARHDTARPGGLIDHFVNLAGGAEFPAPRILRELLIHLGPIWPSRQTLGGIVLGDCWRHPAIRRDDASDGLVPLHKLSQWLCYSLIDPLRAAGFDVTEIDGLTGLAEYRNGGLLLDMGVLRLRDPAQAERPHAVDSLLIVEWRALTVALLDRLLPLVRGMLDVSAQDFPLGAMLEGGTWTAGRRIAAAKRVDGGPPLRIVSDGTVF